jgi:hypothetical protein
MPENQKIISDLIIQFAESGGLSNSDFVEQTDSEKLPTYQEIKKK